MTYKKMTDQEWKERESWLPTYLRGYEAQIALAKLVNKQKIFKHTVTRNELIDFMWFWAERKHILYRSTRDGYYKDLKSELAKESMPSVSEALEGKKENGLRDIRNRRKTD